MSCPLPGAIANLGPSGLTVNCKTTVRPVPAAREGLAASPPAAASVNPVNVVGDPGCVAFSPGRYTAAPNLDGTKVNFFRGGVYYFDSIGNWNINGSKILGGTPQLAEPRQTSLTCGDTTQGGVMFVFGGNSQFTANGSTVVELFAGNAAGGPGVSVYQVMATGGGWTTSSTGNQPMLSIDEIGANRFVAHGQVWMPNGSLKLTQGGGSNGTLQFRAGLVVSDIQNLNNANGPTNFYVTGSRTVTITGIGPLAGGETGVTVTAKAVVVIANDTTIAPRIASWRLS